MLLQSLPCTGINNQPTCIKSGKIIPECPGYQKEGGAGLAMEYLFGE